MIEYNPNKCIVRDDNYYRECQKVIADIEILIEKDSYTAFVLCSEQMKRLSIILEKNNDDYKKYYKVNQDRYGLLRESISWNFIEPIMSFEANIIPVLSEIESKLSEKNYNLNKLSAVKINEAEKLLGQFIEENSFVDKYIRNQYFNKLNDIRRNLENNSLISILLCENALADMETIKKTNNNKYIKSYLSAVKKTETVKKAFEKSKHLIKQKEIKNIEAQFDNSELILKSQDYSKFEESLEILDLISLKISENAIDKKNSVIVNIKNDVEKLKTEIWLEDWDVLKNAIDRLIAQAEESGQILNLNLDKFHIDNKKNEKKEKIYEFINSINKSKINNYSQIIEKAKNMLTHEASLKDLENLKVQISSGRLKKNEVSPSLKKEKKRFLSKNMKYTITSFLLITSLIVFSINQKKDTEYFQVQGQKYADMIEMIVYSNIKNKAKIDIKKIRSRVKISETDMQILSIDEREVVIKYKNKIYKKDVRSQ